MRSKLRNASTSFIVGGAVCVALLGASIGVASVQFDQQPQERETETMVGTYEPQRVFQSSHYGQRLNERLEGLQQEFQQAQQEGDQQRAAQIQAQMQQVQNEVIESFFAEVEQTMPDVVEEAGVKVVALEIVYVDPEFGEPMDLTAELITQLNDGADAEEDRRDPFPPPPAP